MFFRAHSFDFSKSQIPSVIDGNLITPQRRVKLWWKFQFLTLAPASRRIPRRGVAAAATHRSTTAANALTPQPPVQSRRKPRSMRPRFIIFEFSRSLNEKKTRYRESRLAPERPGRRAASWMTNHRRGSRGRRRQFLRSASWKLLLFIILLLPSFSFGVSFCLFFSGVERQKLTCSAFCWTNTKRPAAPRFRNLFKKIFLFLNFVAYALWFFLCRVAGISPSGARGAWLICIWAFSLFRFYFIIFK